MTTPDKPLDTEESQDVARKSEADDFEPPQAIESLCMSCFENGETRLLLTSIPHFREVMIASFECPYCGLRNNEVQFTGSFGEKGVKYSLSVPKGQLEVLSRQVVKSESATVTVPELDFEIPSQKGSVTNVEGLLSEAAAGIRASQPVRRITEATTAAALDEFLERLDACIAAQRDFTLVVDDPAGNSYVESTTGRPEQDPLIQVEHYERTQQQQEAIGLLSQERDQAGPEIAADDPHHGHAPEGAVGMHRAFARMHGAAADALLSRYSAPEEVLEFPGHCSACTAPLTTRMFNIHIPFFKEVIIMSDSCEVCGYKNSEVKGGGAISELGRKCSLQVTTEADLQRDVLKSETASLSVPELELEVTTGTMGGLVTTVEGLLTKVKDELLKTHSFQIGDSADQLSRSGWKDFFERLDDAVALKLPWTLLIQDPLANSFIGPRAGRDIENDPALQLEDYERSAAEDAEFGIDHLKEHGTGVDEESGTAETAGDGIKGR